MVKKISRRIKGSAQSDLFSLVAFILSLPAARAVSLVQAFVALPGMGEEQRVAQVIRVWQSPENSAAHLLIAGHYRKERTMGEINIQSLKLPPFNLKTTDNVLIGPEATNTRESAEWILEQVRDLNIKSLCLFAPAYHLPRAYLTFLKTFLRNHLRIILIPVPIYISPDSIVPETGINAWAMAPGEWRRIVEYQKEGDAATLEESKEYLAWLWQQPLFKIFRK